MPVTVMSPYFSEQKKTKTREKKAFEAKLPTAAKNKLASNTFGNRFLQ